MEFENQIQERQHCNAYTEKTMFPVSFALNGIWPHGDSFPFDFEPNGLPFGSKSKGKLSPWSYPIQCERKWKYSFLSVAKDSVQTQLGNTPPWDSPLTVPNITDQVVHPMYIFVALVMDIYVKWQLSQKISILAIFWEGQFTRIFNN